MSVVTDLTGDQEPRISCVPDTAADWSVADEALEWLEAHNINLDPWQKLVLRWSLARQADGRFAALEVGLNVPRQNGKGMILEARELVGIFVLGEELIIHSAHEFATAEQHFMRLERHFEENNDLARELVKNGIKKSHGQEGFYFKDGRQLRFKTRTGGAGRGFSCDFLALDEAMILKRQAMAALQHTQRARPDMQRFFAGSAVDQEDMANGLVFAHLRRRGIDGSDPGLAYFEWSMPFEHPDELTDDDIRDMANWQKCTPALGIRIRPATIAAEIIKTDRRSLAVELGGVGDWPDPEGALTVVDMAKWEALADPESQIVGPVTFAFDVTKDRSKAAIAVAGRREDGTPHVEIMEHRSGTAWVAPWLAERRKHGPKRIVWAPGPADALEQQMREHRVPAERLTATEEAQACGAFYDLVEDERVRHLGTRELVNALKGAAVKPVGDSWKWSRRSSRVDICPLVAATLALWASGATQPSVYRERGVVVV